MARPHGGPSNLWCAVVGGFQLIELLVGQINTSEVIFGLIVPTVTPKRG
jgi:hypothetical protein